MAGLVRTHKIMTQIMRGTINTKEGILIDKIQKQEVETIGIQTNLDKELNIGLQNK